MVSTAQENFVHGPQASRLLQHHRIHRPASAEAEAAEFLRRLGDRGDRRGHRLLVWAAAGPLPQGRPGRRLHRAGRDADFLAWENPRNPAPGLPPPPSPTPARKSPSIPPTTKSPIRMATSRSGRGSAADVIIRCYRKLGIDLQKEVHEDMAAAFPPLSAVLGRARAGHQHRPPPRRQPAALLRAQGPNPDHLPRAGGLPPR